MKAWLPFLLVLLIALLARAGHLTVAFNPSPGLTDGGTNGVGYWLYGQTNNFDPLCLADSPLKLNLGTNTQASFYTTNSAAWWFAVTAYSNGLESDVSNILPVNFPPMPATLAVLVPQYIQTLSATNWQDLGFFRVKLGPP